jgi:hypothetical protein
VSDVELNLSVGDYIVIRKVCSLLNLSISIVCFFEPKMAYFISLGLMICFFNVHFTYGNKLGLG